MAELLSTNEWPKPGSLGAHVCDALPDEYVVVEEPVVHNHSLDTVVVGPQGIFVLHGRDWKGAITPVPRIPWRQQLPDGQTVQQSNPGPEARQASKALKAFLRDEFPSIHPQVRHFLVLTDPEATLSAAPATEPIAVSLRDVDALIVSRVSPPKKSLPDGETRMALALAIHDRGLSSGQRTAEPFVFRSGVAFSNGTKVWTLRDAAKHMDKHPDDAMFHLHNGTLVRWLVEQGAPEVADMARRITDEYARDPRAGLEVFLTRAGLVKRSRPRVRPKVVNLGYVLAGQSSSARLRVREGKGRGYLTGALETDDPWLRVDPNTLNGEPLSAKVIADTTGLSISPRPLKSSIRINSDAWAEPVTIPVRLRVRGLPSRASTYVLRPLIGLITGLLLGAACGWALGSWGMPAPDWLPGPSTGATSSAVTFAIWVGAIWAVLGTLRGLWQPPAWPPIVALGRWLARLVLWAAALSMVGVAGHWSWGRLSRALALGSGGPTMAAVALIGFSLSALPAGFGGIQTGRFARREAGEPIAGLRLRPIGVAGLVSVLLVVVAIGGHVAVPLWQRYDMASVVSSVREWAGGRIEWVETRLDSFIDGLVLDSYDRRAPPRPTEAPTPSPAAEVTPTGEGLPEGEGEAD